MTEEKIRHLEDLGIKLDENFKLNGYRKDKDDERDFVFKSPVFNLPSKVDFRPWKREIENQGATGSCVANATCSALEMMAKKDGIDINLSRLFVYFEAREPYPDLRGKDGGTYMREGMKACNKFGAPDEKYWEFDESKVNDKPSEVAYEKAPLNKVLRYERVDTNSLNSMKAVLANGNPFIIGMYLFEEFFYLTGDLYRHNYRGSFGGSAYAGGHAMNVIGYDDSMNGGSFILENSWSERWGDNGLCAIPYDVFLKDSADGWVCTNYEVTPENEEPVEPEDNDNNDDISDDFLDKIIDEVQRIIAWIKKSLKSLIKLIVQYPGKMDTWQVMLNYFKKLEGSFGIK
jgi:hypothetical protein